MIRPALTALAAAGLLACAAPPEPEIAIAARTQEARGAPEPPRGTPDTPNAPDPAHALPALFDPAAPDAAPIDAEFRRLLEAWSARPTDEAGAQARLAARRAALAALAEDPRAGDRLAAECAAVPLWASQQMFACLMLAREVETDASLAWLDQIARLTPPPLPPGAHPHAPLPERFFRVIAAEGLGERARRGSAPALERLLTLAGTPDAGDRRAVVAAVYAARPRAHAQRLLRATLPADETYRLYEVR